VIRKIRKACRAGRAAEVDQTQIKKAAGQPLKQIPELDLAHQSLAGPVHERGIRQTENEGDLAGLVLKYFADEISEALMEVQKALAPEAKCSNRQAGHRKG
jgi:hypothetical protein